VSGDERSVRDGDEGDCGGDESGGGEGSEEGTEGRGRGEEKRTGDCDKMGRERERISSVCVEGMLSLCFSISVCVEGMLSLCFKISLCEELTNSLCTSLCVEEETSFCLAEKRRVFTKRRAEPTFASIYSFIEERAFPSANRVPVNRF
jgi:hypothetical protein